ncbi:MAG TPA: hypothetical protein DD502_04065, partial [Cupriavidus sp.]|nr:hypothetical protein [Cupriavidus sp.]
LRSRFKKILESLRGLAVRLVLSAVPPLQGAHVLAGTCRSAGGSHRSRNPCFTLARTASL